MPHRRTPEAAARRAKRIAYLRRSDPNFLGYVKHKNPIINNLQQRLVRSSTENVGYVKSMRPKIVRLVRTCCLCNYDNVGALEIHHIDGDHDNNAWDNISVVCSNCHSLITKGLIDFWQELAQNK